MAAPVVEVAEQLQRLGQAGGGGRVVPGPPLHQAQMVEGPGLAVPVVEVAEQLQRLGQAGGGGRVIPGQPLNKAQLIAGPALPCLSPTVPAAARAASPRVTASFQWPWNCRKSFIAIGIRTACTRCPWAAA